MTNWDRLEETILNKIELINKPNERELEFLGFIKKDLVDKNKSIIKIRNRIYKEEGEITFRAFYKSKYGWLSPTDKKNVYSKNSSHTEKEILEKIDSKIKEIYDEEHRIIKFLGFEEGKFNGNMCETRLFLLDETYNDAATIRCDTFIYNGWTCNKLRYIKSAKSNVKITRDIAIENINGHIKDMNESYGTELEFLGFVDNKWITANSTKLIIRCNKHDVLCYPTYSKFMSKDQYHCPSCNTSTGELDCYNTCKDILIGTEIITQYKIKYYGEHLDCKADYLLVDIVIPDLGLAIEFDGDQHYKFISLFHRQYQNFVDQVNRDNYLIKYCQEHSIKLLRIPYCDRNRIGDILKAFLTEGRDISTHIEPKLLPVPMSYYG